jgi:hypothetical protein
LNLYPDLLDCSLLLEVSLLLLGLLLSILWFFMTGSYYSTLVGEEAPMPSFGTIDKTSSQIYLSMGVAGSVNHSASSVRPESPLVVPIFENDSNHLTAESESPLAAGSVSQISAQNESIGKS